MRHRTSHTLKSLAMLAGAALAAGCGGDKTVGTAAADAASPPAPAATLKELTGGQEDRVEREKAIAAFASLAAPQEVVVEYTFKSDDGGRLLRGLLGNPGRHVAAVPDGGMAAPLRVPRVASEQVAFEQLSPRPWVDALPAPRMLAQELKPTDRRLPQHEQPPIAASDMMRPPLPALPAGALVFAASPSPSAPPALQPVDPAGEPPPPPQFNPVVRVARSVTQPAVVVGRPGPAPFDPIAIPDPLAGADDLPLAPARIPATRPAAAPRLPAPVLPVTLAQSKP